MNWKHSLFGGLLFLLGLLAGFLAGANSDNDVLPGEFIDARAWSSANLADSLEVHVSINFDGFPAEDGKPQLKLSIKNILGSDVIIPGDLINGHRSELWEVRSMDGDLLAVRPYSPVESAAVVLKPGQQLAIYPLWPNCPRLDITQGAFQPGRYLIGLTKFGLDFAAAGFEINHKGAFNLPDDMHRD